MGTNKSLIFRGCLLALRGCILICDWQVVLHLHQSCHRNGEQQQNRGQNDIKVKVKTERD